MGRDEVLAREGQSTQGQARIPLVAFVCLCSSLLLVHITKAQGQDDTGCLSSKVTLSTDRPTYSSRTETTQCGALEIMGGSDRVRVGPGLHQDDLAQGLQPGFTKAFDHHDSGNVFLRDGHLGALSGISDSYVGLRYRFMRQTHSLPRLVGFYTMKVPTANPALGTGTGHYDHFMPLLVSKDLPKVHLDFTVTHQIVGGQETPGYDHNEGFVLFSPLRVTTNRACICGGYGFNALNPSAPAYGVSTVRFDWRSRIG